MKTQILLLIIAIFLVHSEARTQEKLNKFRVVGYVKGELSEMADKIDYRSITHLNIAFINPDSAGAFAEQGGINAIVTRAHKAGVKVLMAIGGGRAPAYYRSLVSPVRRSQFIANLRKFIFDHQLDGIDVDLEGELITSDYEGFVIQLASSVKPSKLITAAVATPYGPQFSSAALAEFDFINIMSYDQTGPWRPQVPGQHAPYAMAVNDLDYWEKERSIPAQRINLGVPFYGYSFGPAGAGSQSYKNIIAKYPGAEEKDEVSMEDGGTMYYNGSPTIKLKTRLALKRTGGVMIWQLLQDATDNSSLLQEIDHEINRKN